MNDDICPNCGEHVESCYYELPDDEGEYRPCLIWECECGEFDSCWLLNFADEQ